MLSAKISASLQGFRSSALYNDKKSKAFNTAKGFVLSLFRTVIIIGISYVILAPVIGIISNSFFSTQDRINPMVFTMPIKHTLATDAIATKYKA